MEAPLLLCDNVADFFSFTFPKICDWVQSLYCFCLGGLQPILWTSWSGLCSSMPWLYPHFKLKLLSMVWSITMSWLACRFSRRHGGSIKLSWQYLWTWTDCEPSQVSVRDPAIDFLGHHVSPKEAVPLPVKIEAVPFQRWTGRWKGCRPWHTCRRLLLPLAPWVG